MNLEYVSNQEIIQAARRNLPQAVWDYLTGGAATETTMRRNRLGFDCLALRRRVLLVPDQHAGGRRGGSPCCGVGRALPVLKLGYLAAPGRGCRLRRSPEIFS